MQIKPHQKLPAGAAVHWTDGTGEPHTGKSTGRLEGGRNEVTDDASGRVLRPRHLFARDEDGCE